MNENLLRYMLSQKRDGPLWKTVHKQLFSNSNIDINQLLFEVIQQWYQWKQSLIVDRDAWKTYQINARFSLSYYGLNAFSNQTKDAIINRALEHIISNTHIENLHIIDPVPFMKKLSEKSLHQFFKSYDPKKHRDKGAWGYLSAILGTNLIDDLLKKTYKYNENVIFKEKIWIEIYRLIENRLYFVYLEYLNRYSIIISKLEKNEYFQEIFIDALLAFFKRDQEGGYKRDDPFLRYLKRIFKNKMKDFLRKKLKEGSIYTKKGLPNNDKLGPMTSESIPSDIKKLDDSSNSGMEPKKKYISFEHVKSDIKTAFLLDLYPHHIFVFLLSQYLSFFEIENTLDNNDNLSKPNQKTSVEKKLDIKYSKIIEKYGKVSIRSLNERIQIILKKISCYSAADFRDIEIKLDQTVDEVLSNQRTYKMLKEQKGRLKYGELNLEDFYNSSNNKNSCIRAWVGEIKIKSAKLKNKSNK